MRTVSNVNALIIPTRFLQAAINISLRLKIFFGNVAEHKNHDMKMMRYSEIPRDISGDSLSALKLTEVTS